MNESDSTKQPVSSHASKRIRYADGIEPVILSSTTTPEGTVFNRIKAGSRPARIVMRAVQSRERD